MDFERWIVFLKHFIYYDFLNGFKQGLDYLNAAFA